jgi:hypothetical protein
MLNTSTCRVPHPVAVLYFHVLTEFRTHPSIALMPDVGMILASMTLPFSSGNKMILGDRMYRSPFSTLQWSGGFASAVLVAFDWHFEAGRASFAPSCFGRSFFDVLALKH